MTTISQRELRNNSAAVMRGLQSGESSTITNRGKVVGRLVPANRSPLDELVSRRAAREGGWRKIPLVVSSLAVAELRRMAISWDLPHELVNEALQGVNIVPMTEPILHHSGVLPHRQLRTLDAIHLATAIAIEARTMMTYDDRLAEAATAEGLLVVSPR